jgi:biopolymer transport protein ExbD
MKTGFGVRKRGEQDFYLQITSLIDTLVIILVFMLMSLGGGTQEVASGVTLPWAIQGAELTQGLKVSAKKDGIYIDEEKIVPMNDSTIQSSLLSEDGKKIVPLFQKLLTISKESKSSADKSGVKFEGKILMQADKGIPIKTIKQILYTSARAGFNDFKFAVIRQ